MTTGSRSAVLFIAFTAVDEPGLVAWTRLRQHVVAATGGSPESIVLPPTVSIGVWRLLASNNREVARSAQFFDSVASARDAVHVLQERSSDLEVSTFHGPVSATHGWAATLDGALAVTCSRWFETGPISLDVASASIESFRCARVAEVSVEAAAPTRGSRARLLSRLS